jgi:hypothetical protein
MLTYSASSAISPRGLDFCWFARGSRFAFAFIHLQSSTCITVIPTMEIFFTSPTQPAVLLSLAESLARQPWETLETLQYTIRNTLFKLADHHRSLLRGSFEALKTEDALFRRALNEFNLDWVPTARERNVIVDAYYKLYPISDIEGAFYEYGGMHGIVALVVVFRQTEVILSSWATIADVAAQRWLVSNVSQLFSSQRNRWVDSFTMPGMPSTSKTGYLR